MKVRARVLMAAAVAAGLGFGAEQSGATTLTWNGTDAAAGGAGTWDASTTTTWNAGTAGWADGSDAVFPQVSGNVTLASGFTPNANSITFSNTSGNYNLGNTGGTINIASTTASIVMSTNTTNTNGQGINASIGGTDITVQNNYNGGTNATARTLLNLNAANTFTGSLILGGTGTGTAFGNANQVALGNANGLGGPTNTNTVKFARNFSNLLFTSGGNGGAAAYTASYANDIDLNSTGSTGANGFTSGIGSAVSGTVITLNGVIKGTGDANLVFTNGLSGGQGKIIVNNNATYSGSTALTMASSATTSGVVMLGVNNALPTGTALTLGNASAAPSGTLDMGGKNQTVASLATGALFTGGGNAVFLSGITNTGGTTSTLHINGSANTTYAAALGASVTTAVTGTNDNIALVLDATNTGTLTLKGVADTANGNITNGFKGVTYAGGTTINGGTLIVANTANSGTGSGNITIGAAGTLKIGDGTSFGGANGSVAGSIANNGNVIFNRSDSVTFGGSQTISGTGNVTQNGAGTVSLTSVNTYTGNTIVSAGTLALADDAGLKFLIGATGVNNNITGTGTANLNGDFTFDLSGAGTTAGDNWSIVDVATLTETFGATFTVVGFTETANVWTKSISPSLEYQFSEATGVLQVVAVPEPAALGLLAVGGVLLGRRGRRRA